MHDAVMLEAAGRPTAVIVTTEFVLEGRAQRDALGMTGLDAVVIEHPLSSLTEEEIGKRIDEALPQIERTWLGAAAHGDPRYRDSGRQVFVDAAQQGIPGRSA